jgi:hypothetical protein
MELLMSKKLKENQVLAAEFLAAGKTGRAVAAEIGVTEETISRWRQTDEFQAAINSYQWEVRRTSTERLRNLMGQSVDVIESTLTDENVLPRLRLQTAFKIIELCELVDRLADRPGPDTAEGIERQRERAEEQAERDREAREERIASADRLYASMGLDDIGAV